MFKTKRRKNIEMKHAYLIIANRNPKQVNKLLNCLDDSRNDIYVLIDKKSKQLFPKYKTLYSNINYLQPLNIWWGDYSQIKAELELFKAASYGNYEYYHLLSGLDLPLENQDKVHAFFDNNLGKEFITYSSVQNQKDLEIRLHKYLFSHHFRTKNKVVSIINEIEKRLFTSYNQKRVDIDYIEFGSNWVTIENELVHSLIENEDSLYKMFNRGFLVDELFIPIFLNMHPKFKKRVFYEQKVTDAPDELQGNLRYINWWDGSPYVWRLSDYETLKNAKKMGHLFARKFDETVDESIINKIVKDCLK